MTRTREQIMAEWDGIRARIAAIEEANNGQILEIESEPRGTQEDGP